MDFWIQCPSCKGTASYETRLEASCETCDDRGVVRLTPENCQGHDWVVKIVPLAGYWRKPYDRYQRTRHQTTRFCRWCGTKQG